MEEKQYSLPVFGIGPVYVLSCLVLTIMGLLLNHRGLLNCGRIPLLQIPMLIGGLLLIIAGVFLWVFAVIVQRIGREIKRGKLVTSGVYSLVRNPIYSAFIFIFTGILLMVNNILLLILPILFWLYLTILLKNTEEKWLLAKFGQAYLDYCQKVNRVIPWWRKK